MAFNAKMPGAEDWLKSDGSGFSAPAIHYLGNLERVTRRFNDRNGLTDSFAIGVSLVANQDYTVNISAPTDGKITATKSQSDSGTCTVTWKIGGVALSGTASSASTSIDTDAQDDEFSAGDKITITVSSNSSCKGLFAQAIYSKPYA